MSMPLRRFVFCLALLIPAVLAGAPAAWATTYYRGTLNGWGTTALNADSDFGGGNYYAVTITSATNEATSNLKFDTGSWSFSWGAGASASKNSSIGTANHEGSGNLSFSGASNTWRYTFRIKDPESYWLRDYVVMETAGDPVGITNVFDNHINDPAPTNVTVTIQLSGSLGAQEKVWVRFATNSGFSPSWLVPASGSSTNFTAIIPAQPSGTRVRYYVLTSTMPSNIITSEFDLTLLRGKKSGTSNYFYRAGPGNSWHIPTNAEPSGAFMRNPPTNGVHPAQSVYIYNGTYSNLYDQTGGTLYYRLAGAGGWTATNLSWDSNSGTGNQYWKSRIPGGTFGNTNQVQYYLKITYSDADTTYLGTTDGGASCVKYLVESGAQSNAFSFTYGGLSLPAAPVILPAAATNATDFTAAWQASAGATNYFLDVSTGSIFIAGNLLINENFDSFFPPPGWDASGATSATTYAHSGTNSVRISGNTQWLMTPTVTNAVSLSFWTYWSLAGRTTLVEWTDGAVTSPVATVVATVSNVFEEVAVNVAAFGTGRFIFRRGTAANLYIDDVALATASSYVPGYQNRAVGDVATASVTGLTVGVTYYYRVRAQNSLGVSGDSGTQAVTTVAAPFNPGNSWHIPANAEPAGAYMRNPPTNGVSPAAAVYIYNGTYTNDHNQTGGTLYHRLVGGGAWSATNLAWDSNAVGGNQYWVAPIPGGVYAASNQVEYYLRITYANADTTYLGTTNNTASSKFQAESAAQSNTFKFTYGQPAANLGNCWHYPTNAEPAGAFMRNPVTPGAGQTVFLYNGVYTNENNQTGGSLIYRKSAAATWVTNALAWDSNVAGGNQYWTSAIPAGTYLTGDTIEYYFKITFANADTTWLGSTNNLGSIKYAAAADAQAHPFTFTYAAAIPPAPVVLPAAATNATDFTAAWQASAGATNYFLDVAQTAAFIGADLVNESFEGAFPPAGWEAISVEQTNQYAHTGTYSVRINANGDILGTPTVTNAAALALWTYWTSTGRLTIVEWTDGATTSAVGTATSTVGAAWEQISFNVGSFGAGRFQFRRGSTANLYIDDVVVSAAGYVPGYQNRSVGNVTSHAVTGLTQGATYYYRLRASNADGVSGDSGTQAVTTTTSAFNPGNCWHYPTNAEPAGAFMRNPVNPSAGDAVYFYNGVYTNEHNQTGGRLIFRKTGAATWTTNLLAWDSNPAGGNQYWKTNIPAGVYAAGDTIEYYFKITFANADTTFLGSTNNLGSIKYQTELEAQAHPFTFTYSQNLGNCWHIPANAEPPGAYMRNPRNPYTNNTIYIYNGNQFQGAGNPGDQTGGTLYHRLAGGSWSAVGLAYDSQMENNKYWVANIAAGAYQATNVVEYCLAVTYNDHDTTYLGTTNGGVASVAYASLAEAQTHPFSFTMGGAEGSEAAFIWHNTNRVNLGSGAVQFWAKIGYAQGIGTNRWVDYAAIYYTTNGVDPSGATGSAGNASTMVQLMTFDHMEEDSYPDGDAMWWAGVVSGLPTSDGSTIKYKIGAWKAGGVERFAEYGTAGADNQVFSFSLFVAGAAGLTVNGVNADYTTTKFFIDEAAGETQYIRVVYVPDAGASNVQVFCNLNRRDFCDVDYSNSWIHPDGYADGIKPPDGNLIGVTDTGAYFTAFAMSGGPTTYYWTGAVSRCGAYRLTARYQKNATSATNWIWYSNPGGLRDHAVVASPKKVLQQTMYELNALTVEATDNTEAGRSTFQDLLGAADGDADGYDPFNLEYLNFIQANCLWFQPIHPSAEERKDAYTPGSPYATKNYYAVSKWFGADTTEAGALREFTNFVAKCDAYTGSVGTINIMLDGVFNHTAWDAIMGAGGVYFGFCTNVNDRIGWFKPGWYSYWQDYGAPATYYHSAYSNDIATAPDRGDFGKWFDVAELFYGNYSALVRHNPDNNGDYLNEGDVYDFAGMSTTTMDLWKYMAWYTEYWLKQTGHSGSNTWIAAQDDRGIDGLRCDFGQGLPPQLWEYIINRTRRMKWNFMFMAETLDGGKPGYRSNRHFDVLNENIVFKFTQERINDSWSLKQALEDRRSAYSGGAILLNLTSHDEVLPGNDAWMTASRFGAVSAVDGIPMIFYGQEQGIQNWAGSVTKNTGFKTPHEENFGKFIPNFKQWNQLTVWTNPPDYSTGLAQWYGRVNWARLNSAALRSQNRYFLSKMGGGDEGRILAVAKYDEPYRGPASNDVVLAFALMLRNDEASHVGANATYDLQPVWGLLGLSTAKTYRARNLVSSNALNQYVWTNMSGAALYNSGIWVALNAGTAAAPITADGELVQFLKIEEEGARPPVIYLPGPHILPVGAITNFVVTASDPEGGAITLSNTVYPAGATFMTSNFAWTAASSFENTTNAIVFIARSSASGLAATNATTITVPFDFNQNGIGDGWEWDNFSNLTNPATSDNDGDWSDDYHEYIAGTEPTNAASFFHISAAARGVGTTNRLITIPTALNRHYRIYFADGISNAMPWFAFGNTNNRVGTWTETNWPPPTTYTFVDDETTNTTFVAPASGRRYYKVRVEKP